MAAYTDIASEIWQKTGAVLPAGVSCSNYSLGDIAITKVIVATDELEKPRGTYVTVDMPELAHIDDHNARYIDTVAAELALLLPKSGTVLVAGIGNSFVSTDSLGPKVAQKIFVTRHIEVEPEEAEILNLRPVAAVQTQVEGKTGFEAVELIRSLCAVLKPAAVICVDALSTKSATRLGCTVQVCDAGLSPGGGRSAEITQKTVGTKVIAIGVPTIMDAAECCEAKNALVITPRDIDYIVLRAANIISAAINRALQQGLTQSELNFLTS